MSRSDSTLHARLVDELGATQGRAALCVLSLDNLGRIAGEHGIRASERAVRAFDERVSSIMRRSDRKLVLAPDRICVVFDELRDANHALLVALKIERTFEEPLDVEDQVITLIPRAGLAYCGAPRDRSPAAANQLYQSAETARELAVAENVCFHIADPTSVRRTRRDWNLDDVLADALRDHHLELAYQPQVDLQDRRVVALEALPRWHRKDQILTPAEFLPKLSLARRHALADYCLRGAMKDGAELGDVPIAINLDPCVVRDETFLEMLHREAAIWQVDPGRLSFEISERGLLADYPRAAGVLTKFRESGYRIAIDGFGSGASSLRHFGSLPVDELKVDRSFIHGLLASEANVHITQTIIDLGHRFELCVSAEGVEDAATAEHLHRQGCDAAQGPVFSEALDLEAAIALLAEGGRLPADE